MESQTRFTCRLSIVLLALSLTAGATFGQRKGNASDEAAAAPVASSAFDQKRFDSLRTEGFDALYNLDYEVARRHFKEMTRLFPDHPAGFQFLGATLWVQTLNESRRLQASLYNTEAFYAKSEEKTDPKIVAEFRELTRQAKQLAEARIRRNPKDVEALYFLGATEGLKAAFAGAVERSFMSALRDGQDSVERHREVLKLDPEFHDAELTIGMYDYVVSTLPPIVKVMAAVGGIRGSKKRGLETLARVTREGRWAQDDAKTLLIALLKRERRFTEALALARSLMTKYPRNYLYKLEVADALVSQAALDRPANATTAANFEREAFQIFDDLLRPERTTHAPARRGAANAAAAAAAASATRPLDQIYFSYGQALFITGQFERAAKEYLSGANFAGAEPGLATMSRLRAAQSLDLAGKRDAALEQYKLVLTRPNIYDSHEEAKHGLREPFKKAVVASPTAETSDSGEVLKKENEQ
ncbi:MAG TPA: hypothetical protein VNA19_07620 [Pyrinomonadaceae bacterium]|jgi:hypothetical protein|nr:hypothetical protein [Pyrinomonadaceae bacterium]